MEAEAAFVGPQGTVELDPEAAVDMNNAFVILPGYPEDDLTFRFTDALDDLALKVLGVFDHDRAEGFQHLENRLMKLGFTRVALQYVLIDSIDFFIQF
jgi:hypothetical protein